MTISEQTWNLHSPFYRARGREMMLICYWLRGRARRDVGKILAFMDVGKMRRHPRGVHFKSLLVTPTHPDFRSAPFFFLFFSTYSICHFGSWDDDKYSPCLTSLYGFKNSYLNRFKFWALNIADTYRKLCSCSESENGMVLRPTPRRRSYILSKEQL